MLAGKNKYLHLTFYELHRKVKCENAACFILQRRRRCRVAVHGTYVYWLGNAPSEKKAANPKKTAFVVIEKDHTQFIDHVVIMLCMDCLNVVLNFLFYGGFGF
jgi:hypothetical protein